jgi:hypothetical protein
MVTGGGYRMILALLAALAAAIIAAILLDD